MKRISYGFPPALWLLVAFTILAWFLAGCTPRHLVKFSPQFGEGYAYVLKEDGTYLVVTKDISPTDTDNLEKAKTALGCGPCSVGWIGSVWEVAPPSPED